ncbi:uncharacterized protein LOC103695462 isoform X2 [Phoenix dactylifera]|uniref:Uncharacterized protein LOC103695462 isoform X2 n=1 Tax=Phoenix dactylifera TaxID=42345 RepID=A0A8B8ZFH1_PHODC|nr:uncharacterized protein LOC103695462 isoform X2 [Phoenix dactylifera]
MPMAGTKRSSPSPISIGNCEVQIEGKGIVCESSKKNLLISVSNDAKIKISVDDTRRYTPWKSDDSGGECFPLEGHSFLLLNPKDVDSRGKSLLQEVLKLYIKELPSMNYAANTGKKSQFLERCVSNGKYRTLILKSDSVKCLGKVIAAISYQIIPTDTQYAEIPLAAVSSNNQKKGIGQLLYKELNKRLQSVGISTLLCWADEVSEGFWLKQGFISVGEVNSRGKTRRLPIKADIRRVLCYPGGSTLMVSQIKKDLMNFVNSSKHVNLCSLSKSHAKSPSNAPSETPGLTEIMTRDTSKYECPSNLNIIPDSHQMKNSKLQKLMSHGCSTDRQKAEGFPPDAVMVLDCTNLVPLNNVGCNGNEVDLGVAENEFDTDGRCSLGQRVKRQIWEATLSSLKSKRIRGGHLIGCCQESNQDIACESCSLETSGCEQSVRAFPKDSICHAEGNRFGDANNDLVLQGNCPIIMLMNIADDAKKACLTKIVIELGGAVTCEGSSCTHVITGKARRTLNFCTALCSGAWIVSPNWLKDSFREGRFLGESQFILEDEEYLLKYKSDLRDVVMRAKANPHSLLRGYHVCLAKHIQPSSDVLSTVIKSAGGNDYLCAS